MKAGILLVTSGVVPAEACAARARLERQVSARFGMLPVRWAAVCGAGRVTRRQGGKGASLEDALAAMRRDGFTRVAVQPLQVVAGAENRALRATVAAFSGRAKGFSALHVGAPLLSSEADAQRVAQAVLAGLPGARRPEDAVILIAHGSREAAAERAYAALAQAFAVRDSRVLLGRTLGRPGRAETVQACVKLGARRVFLLPFMVRVGATALAALADDGPASWPAALRLAGIAGAVAARGLAEDDAVVEVWLDHLHDAWSGRASLSD